MADLLVSNTSQPSAEDSGESQAVDPVPPPAPSLAPSIGRVSPQAKSAVIAGLIAFVVLATVLGIDLWRTYRQLEEQAFSEAQSLANVFAAHVMRDIAAVDGMLRSFAERVRRHDSDGGIHGSQIEDEASLLLEGLAATGLALIDPSGQLVAKTWNSPTTDFSDAPAVRAILDHSNGAEPVIGGLQMAPNVGNWIVPITRGVYRTDGTLIGVVGATLSPGQFVAPFADINGNRFSTVTLFQSDGTLIARAPGGEQLVGRSVASSELFQKFLPVADQGSVRYRGVLLNRDLVLSYRRLPGTPFIIATSFDGGEVFGPLYRLIGIYLILGSALSLAVAGCAWLAARDQARRQTIAAAHRVRTIIDGISGFIALFSVDGAILEINKGPLYRTRIARENIIGRKLWQTGWCSYSNEVEARTRFLMGRAAAGEKMREDLVIRVGPDLYRTVDVTFQPIEESDGTRYIIGSGVDVTDQRRLAEQLRQSQKMEALGLLAGGIAHDFNNLLASMSHFAQFLVEDLDPASPQRGFADRLFRACGQGKDIVAQILTYAKPDAVERIPIDLVATVAAARDLVDSSIADGIAFECGLPNGGSIVVVANQGQLTQILLNLCVNAVDAVDADRRSATILPNEAAATLDRTDLNSGPVTKGIVRLELAEASPDDPTHPLRPGGIADPVARYRSALPESGQRYARISVRDTGCGFDQQVLERIFDPFFTTKTRGRGTGLGLAVVHSIVHSLGGLIEVESSPGEGAIFAIYLPLSEIAVAVPARVTSVAAAGAGEERILVVEDDADVGDAMAIGLERAGYDVTVAIDPAEALQVMREVPEGWGLVITDHNLPTMTGVQLIRELRAICPDLPAILHTGSTDPASRDPDLLTGIDAFLPKPADPASLAATVRAVLDRRRS